MSSVRRVSPLFTVLGVLALGFSNAHAAPTTPQVGGPDKLIVVLRDDVRDPGAVAQEHANAHALAVAFVYEHALKGYAANGSAGRRAALERDSRVLFVSEDREVHTTAQTIPTGIDRIDGESSSALSGNGSGSVASPAVAVLDTGIDTSHPELNVAGGKNCANGKSYRDGNGHGTHVAGTIAAKDNGDGVVGVAPGAPLYAVRVLDNSGFGSWSWIICGIDWVTNNAASRGIKVANMSLGGSGSDDGNCGNSNSDALHKAICGSVNRAGVTYVVAAGNQSGDFSGFVPAAYNEVLTVTSVADFNGAPGGGAASTCRSDVDDTAANSSNYTSVGSSDESHTIAAPGVCIYSTSRNGNYATMSGTSMATPHVTGAAALCIGRGLCSGTTSTIMSKLRSDAAAAPATYGFTDDPRTPNGSRYYGHLLYARGY